MVSAAPGNTANLEFNEYSWKSFTIKVSKFPSRCTILLSMESGISCKIYNCALTCGYTLDHKFQIKEHFLKSTVNTGIRQRRCKSNILPGTICQLRDNTFFEEKKLFSYNFTLISCTKTAKMLLLTAFIATKNLSKCTCV